MAPRNIAPSLQVNYNLLDAANSLKAESIERYTSFHFSPRKSPERNLRLIRITFLNQNFHG